MAIPSGSGTEVAKTLIYAATDYTDIVPPNDHIYIILNIVIKNNHSSVSHFDLERYDGTTTVWMLEEETLAKDQTFVWNDRIILVDNTSRLRVYNAGTDSLHLTLNLIDQDWT